jgi:hypothetical protein
MHGFLLGRDARLFRSNRRVGSNLPSPATARRGSGGRAVPPGIRYRLGQWWVGVAELDDEDDDGFGELVAACATAAPPPTRAPASVMAASAVRIREPMPVHLLRIGQPTSNGTDL